MAKAVVGGIPQYEFVFRFFWNSVKEPDVRNFSVQYYEMPIGIHDDRGVCEVRRVDLPPDLPEAVSTNVKQP